MLTVNYGFARLRTFCVMRPKLQCSQQLWTPSILALVSRTTQQSHTSLHTCDIAFCSSAAAGKRLKNSLSCLYYFSKRTQYKMPYTRIMSLKHTDKLGESLSRVYSDPFELNTAALHLKEYIQGHYDAAARSPYTFTEVTKDRLLKGKRMGMIGQRAWPSHAKEVLEPHGLTEVIVTDSGNWVAVVRFVDDQEEVGLHASAHVGHTDALCATATSVLCAFDR